MKSTKLISVVLGVLSIGLVGCGGDGGSTSTIFTFDGSQVTKDEYLKRLETMGTVAVRLPNGQVQSLPVADALSAQALRQLIEQEALLKAARDEGVLPTKDQIEREKKLRTDLRPAYVNELKQRGLSVTDIDNSLLVELARENLQTRGTREKTLEEVEDYIKANPEQFTTPETCTLRVILVNVGQMQQQVDDALSKGQTFQAVAATYSMAPGAKLNNGAFPFGAQVPQPIAVAQLDAELKKIVAELPAGRISNWITSGNQRVKISIESKNPAAKRTLSPQEKELLKRNLRVADGQAQNDLTKIVVDKLLAAKVVVMPPYLKQSWETYFKSVKERSGDILGTSSGDKPKPSPAPAEK